MLKWFQRSPAPAAAQPVAPAAAVADPDALMREAFPLHEAGRVEEAAARYRQILAVAPDYADALYLLGSIAQEAGRREEALTHLRRAVRVNAREPAFALALGECCFALGLWDEAAQHLRATVELDPANVQAWTQLGCACEKTGRLAEATSHFDRALALAPDSPQALNNYAMALKDRGRVVEALPLFRKARDLNPDDPDPFSNYLYSLNFTTQHPPDEIHREHLAFDRAFGSGRHGLPAVRRPADADPERPLRIGYFSPDLRAHPVTVFLEPVLRHRDAARYPVTCYNLYAWPDATSRRLAALCERWVDCAADDDARLAERIAADGIDILVDLAGHTGHNRLPVLARKPAPIIVTWLGYPNTTGLAAVDYRITDALADPPGLADTWHSERLIRLPGAQWCYARPDVVAPVAPLPAATSGALCFGSFNNASKINAESLALWARMLARVERSWLLVWGVADEQRARIAQTLRELGIDRGRLEFIDRTPFRPQLQAYGRVDIVLDTFPYGGVTTTFNSLWMGVPVLTLSGAWSASRSGESILRNLGLGDWVAHTADEFVALGAAKAAAPDALAALRASLRARLETSALADGPAFARKLEGAYRELWQRHVAT